MNETIFIASDHAGFNIKKQILNTVKAKLIDLDGILDSPFHNLEMEIEE